MVQNVALVPFAIVAFSMLLELTVEFWMSELNMDSSA